MKKGIIFIFLLWSALFQVKAQQPSTVTSADIYLGLRKLNVLGSVLYIAAHPDDENTRLLTYLAKDKLYRTGYLSLTRGDGGQNLIGNEQGFALGLIRTQELLAARRIDGAEQFFSRAYDFGFSKSPEETFTKWDKEKILSDVVWQIRKFQPDVIITRFPTTGEGGHGQHTASAILANEAFTAAADPKRFPEQLKYVQPWQAKRILWNTFNFGGNNTTSENQFKIDAGGFNAVLGKSYGEIAAESRSQHKSQGFGAPRTRGEAWEYFKTTGGGAPQTDLMNDVDVSWKRVNGGESIAQSIEKVIASFDFLQPQKSIPQLEALYKSFTALPSGYWKNLKLAEVKNLIAQCSGIWMEATTSVQNAVLGDSITINFNLNNRSGANLQLQKITVDAFDSAFNLPLAGNKNFTFSKPIFIAQSKPISQPYWLKEKMTEGMFTVNDQQIIGQPDVTPAFTVSFDITIDGMPFSYQKPVQYKYADPVKGEIYQPVFVVPPVTVMNSPHIVLFQKDQKQQQQIAIQLSANKNIASKAAIEIHSPNYAITQTDPMLSLGKGFSKDYYFTISNQALKNSNNDNLQSTIHFNNNNQQQDANLAMVSINYEHIPSIRYFYNDAVKVLNIDVKTAGKKIGYIVGAGDKVPEALEQLGYEVTLLGPKELAGKEVSGIKLKKFDAIITGVRAYNTNDWLNRYYDELMQYVKDGGNMIVQYNQLGSLPNKIGPYPFTISRNRITDENAPVTFLKPQHPVLNYPNKITADDFKGWIQERSTYHASDIDKNYETILSMNDPGEKPDDGSLIVGKYGSGYFTYTGLVFFRELPAGVPGAYRLLANIIALNSKKSF